MIIGNAISVCDLRKKGSVPTDADAQAFITATGITGTNATATNKLVIDLKAANIWTKMKAVYPLVGGNATSHKFNLLNPVDSNGAFRLVFAGGLTHSSTGVKGNNTNGWANTFLTPSTSLALNNFHYSFNINNDAAGTFPQASMGVQNSTSSKITISSLSSTTQYSYMGRLSTPAIKTVTATTQKGFWCGSRTADNVSNLLDPTGTFTLESTIGTYTLPTAQVGLIADYNSVTLAGAFSNYGYSFFSIGDGLTTTEMTAFKTAVNNFQTTLGRI